jgi:hypothetical protein
MNAYSRQMLAVALAASAFAVHSVHGQTQAGARPDSADPIAVFKAYQDGLNAGDSRAVAAVWAEDAQFSGGMGCTMAKPCVGQEALRTSFFEPAVAMKMTHHTIGAPRLIQPDLLEARQEVTWQGIDKYSADIKRIVGTDVVRVRDGRILWKVFTPDLSDDQTRRYYDASARAREASANSQAR